MPERHHIAIVDDESQIREAVGEYFELHGFRVSLADGGEALREILEGNDPPDLVILDLNMPGEDGLSIARRLRENSNIGILILTAAGQTLDRIIGIEVGADDYMGKPFDLRELLARTKSVLRRVRPASGKSKNADDRLRIGPLILDSAARKLLDGDGVEIPLTTMEFDLLVSLARNPDRVMDRNRLLDLSHKQNNDPFDRSIDVRIARLRRKIEPEPSRPRIIKTVRGIGYMLVSDPAE